MKTAILLFALGVNLASAATWYIRPDGGTRQQCNGHADAPYSGSGTGQPCAMKHLNYLFTKDLPGTSGSWNNDTPAWIISGGDTVILKDGEYRIGYKTNESTGFWNFTGCRGDTANCFNPVIPAGTAENPTRIVGEKWASGCASKPILRGGVGVTAVLNLKGAKNVAVECLEISDFAQCGTGSVGADGCVRSGFPKGDYALRGIQTDDETDGLLLRNLNIHGMSNMGIRGRIGGTITAENVRISGTQGGGWDNDDGGRVHSTGTLILRKVLIEWSGCMEEYPIRSPLPLYKCYDQSHGGYGDGLGLLMGAGMKVVIEDSTFRYNVQDAVDLLYVNGPGANIKVERSQSYTNGGQQWKFGPVDKVEFTNNLTISNCRRLAEPMTGLPSTYRAGWTDFCRAHDAIALVFSNKTRMDWVHNTFVGYNSTLHDLICRDGDAPECPDARFNFKNNVVVGYPRKDTRRVPTLFYYIDVKPETLFAGTARQHNLACGILTAATPALATEAFLATCPKTWLAKEPAFVNEGDLDALDLHTNPAGPLGNAAGVSAVSHDFTRAPRPLGVAADIGAFEVTGGSTIPPPPPPPKPVPAAPQSSTGIQEFNFSLKVICDKAKPDCTVTVKKE